MFTLIPSDGMAYVDGVALPVDCSRVSNRVHAVQWDERTGRGEIEFGDVNVPIDTEDFEKTFRPYKDAWYAKKAEIEVQIGHAVAPVAGPTTPQEPVHVIE